jgi:hypothetical protein
MHSIFYSVKVQQADAFAKGIMAPRPVEPTLRRAVGHANPAWVTCRPPPRSGPPQRRAFVLADATIGLVHFGIAAPQRAAAAGGCNTLCYGFVNYLLITFISSLTTYQILG